MTQPHSAGLTQHARPGAAVAAPAAVVDADAADSSGAATSTPEESLRKIAGTDPAAGESEASQRVYAGMSAEAGWAVPMPDPANPTDHLGWLLHHTVTDGPSAVPLYQAALRLSRFIAMADGGTTNR